MLKISIFLALCVNSALFSAATCVQRTEKHTLTPRDQLRYAHTILNNPSLPTDIRELIFEMDKRTTWKSQGMLSYPAVPGKLSKNGRYITSVHPGTKVLSVTDIQQNRCIRSIRVSEHFESFVCSDEGSVVAIVNTTAPRVQIYRAVGDSYVEADPTTFWGDKMAMSADGTTLVLTCLSSLFVRDIAHNRELSFRNLIRGNIAISDDGNRIVSLNAGKRSVYFYRGNYTADTAVEELWDYNIQVSDKNGSLLNEFSNAGDDDSLVAISGDGNTVACYNFHHKLSAPARIRVWNCTTNQLVLEHVYSTKGHGNRGCLSLSYDGSFLLLKVSPNKIELWDTRTSTIKQTFEHAMNFGDPLFASVSHALIIPHPATGCYSSIWSLEKVPGVCESIMKRKQDGEEADAICNHMQAPLPLFARCLIAQYVATPSVRKLFLSRYGLDISALDGIKVRSEL